MPEGSSGGLICLQKKAAAQGQKVLAMRRKESTNSKGLGLVSKAHSRSRSKTQMCLDLVMLWKGISGSQSSLMSPICTQAEESIESKAHF